MSGGQGAGLRTSPIDGLNRNRVFPDDPDGTPTPALAHSIDSVLMPLADYPVDLHSGGSSLMYLPTAPRVLRRLGEWRGAIGADEERRQWKAGC